LTAAFTVHAHFVLGANVHQNHLLLAIPLAILSSAGRGRWRGVAYGFSENVSPSRRFPGA
jgi:hypothetical protein